MQIYRHHTADDVIELDQASGMWHYVEEDDAISPGELAIAWRHSYPVAGSYTIEDGHRYCMYWTSAKVLLLRTPDEKEYPLFRYLGEERYEDLRHGMRVELGAAEERDGSTRAGYNTLRLTAADGTVLHEMSYHAQPYLDLYLSDFSAADRDLASWDFFVDLKRGVEEMEALSVSGTDAQDLPAGRPLPDSGGAALLQARSGQPCPQAGSWVIADRLAARRRFAQGEALPEHEGQPVTWLWVDA